MKTQMINWAATDGTRGGFYIHLNESSSQVFIGTQWGNAPRIEVVKDCFQQVLSIWHSNNLLPAFSRRVDAYRVTSRNGMSGAGDLYLETISEGQPVPRRMAKLHISMYGKLNEGFQGYLLDAIELFSAAAVAEKGAANPEGDWRDNIPWIGVPSSLDIVVTRRFFNELKTEAAIFEPKEDKTPFKPENEIRPIVEVIADMSSQIEEVPDCGPEKMVIE